jgi:hypothetical protein
LFGYCVLGLGAGLEDALGVGVGGAPGVAVADGAALTGAVADGVAPEVTGDAIAEGAPDEIAA